MVPSQIEQIGEVCRKEGAREIRIARTGAEANKLWTARKVAFSSMARSAPTLYVEDVTVPRSKIPEMVKTISELAAISGKVSYKSANFRTHRRWQYASDHSDR